MKRILFLLVIITFLFATISVITKIIDNSIMELYVIDSDLIELNRVNIDKNTLSFSGRVVGNSFYGAYSTYKYKIMERNIYITFYSSGKTPNDNEIINFQIYDDKLYNVTNVYIGDKLIFSREK